MVVGLVFGVEFAGQFQDEASVKDSQGNEYHLLNSNFLMGTNVAIAKVLSHSDKETKYKVLVEDPGKEGTLQMVRKTGVPDAPRLFLTSNGLLIGLLYGSSCIDAYDLKNKIAYGAEISNHKVKELSPFALLVEGDVPNEQDFQTLLHRPGDDKPNIAVIKKDLTSQIPIVRKLAARYLKEK